VPLLARVGQLATAPHNDLKTHALQIPVHVSLRSCEFCGLVLHLDPEWHAAIVPPQHDEIRQTDDLDIVVVVGRCMVVPQPLLQHAEYRTRNRVAEPSHALLQSLVADPPRIEDVRREEITAYDRPSLLTAPPFEALLQVVRPFDPSGDNLVLPRGLLGIRSPHLVRVRVFAMDEAGAADMAPVCEITVVVRVCARILSVNRIVVSDRVTPSCTPLLFRTTGQLCDQETLSSTVERMKRKPPTGDRERFGD